MRGALAARALPPGDLWLIADDIMTTGATLSEAARALRAAGGEDKFLVGLAVAGDAREVSCLTLMPEVFFNEYTGKNCVVFKSHNE
jgi:adenine/guanine phosphoribosyltransferase-like PRPP-binding protein